MVTNAFGGKSEAPTEEDLAAELGEAKPVWDQLLDELARECDLTEREWHSYSVKAGWALRFKRKDRNIVYLSPGRGSFLASFALGDRAVQAAREARLPKTVMQVIDSARRYAEGTAVRLEVRRPKDLAAIKKLTAIKLAH